MKITYLCPATNKPSGGIKRIFRHVKFLVEVGYDACIGLPSKCKEINWFEHDVPIVRTNAFVSTEGDAYVVPDGFIHMLDPIKDKPIKKVVLALGFMSPFYNLAYGRNWDYYGVDAVMTNNRTITEFLYFSKIWPAHKQIHLLSSSVDKSLFYYEPQKKKKLVACYNKYKDGQMKMLVKIMKMRGYGSWEFIELDGYTFEEYASIVRSADIFLCRMYCEGFSVPILEAMMSGCLCVGSHGAGGADFVIDKSVKSLRLGRSSKNFILATAGDLYDFARKLSFALDLVETNRQPQLDNIRSNAVVTASQFTERDEKESILDFWKEFLG